MQVRVGDARRRIGPPALAIAATLLLAAPRGARAQGEWTIGPFVGFTGGQGAQPFFGAQTTVIAGAFGLRASGFVANDQRSTAWSETGAPRFGGDADLMVVLNGQRHDRSTIPIAPYAFAGAGVAFHQEPFTATGNQQIPLQGWSYGAGVIAPFGNAAELLGEIRARPTGFFNPAVRSGTSVEYRVGLSFSLTGLFSRRRRVVVSSGPPSRPTGRSTASTDVILGTIGDIAGASASAGSAARVIPTAERYLGTPYRYGGTSPVTGFDCSGFVQYVFARNAVKLPRTSRQQAKVGFALPRSFQALSAGDLVMFAEHGEPISHVAIYAGHNRIIHASASGGEVRFDDLSTARGHWFVQHMVAARRVTPNGHGLMLDLVKMLDAKSLLDTSLDIGDHAPRP